MKKYKYLLSVLLVLGLVLPLSGCGDDDDDGMSGQDSDSGGGIQNGGEGLTLEEVAGKWKLISFTIDWETLDGDEVVDSGSDVQDLFRQYMEFSGNKMIEYRVIEVDNCYDQYEDMVAINNGVLSNEAGDLNVDEPDFTMETHIELISERLYIVIFEGEGNQEEEEVYEYERTEDDIPPGDWPPPC